jgi:type I restriction enzyme M protein
LRAALHSANDSLKKKGSKEIVRLKAKQLELVRKFFGTRDKNAEPVTNEKGDVLPDVELREAEYIPFSVLKRSDDVMSGIQAYFDAEVKPHWDDAWVNMVTTDGADDEVGLVGCEINFAREFYIYQPPRRRDAIREEIESMEARFMEMLRSVVG